MSLSEKDLTDLAYNGLCSYFKEKLEGFDFLTVNHLQMRAIGLEFKFKNSKDSFKPHRSNTHVVENDSDCSDDEEKEVYAAEFVWPSKDKPSTCPSLKPIQKNWQNEMKFTFMFPNVIEILMNCLNMEIFIYLMLYHRRRN